MNQTMAPEADSGVRLAELMAALSIATDLGMGQPMEHALSTCIVAVRLGEAAGLSGSGLHDVYYEALLRTVGQPTLAAGLEAFGFNKTAHCWQLVEAQIDYQQRFADALDNDPGGPFEIILCPPCALPALTHGASTDLITVGAYACLYNLLGYPAGVVPVSKVRVDEQVGRSASSDMINKAALKVEQGSAGLPVGVQLVARPWREHVALAAMQAIEQEVGNRMSFVPPV